MSGKITERVLAVALALPNLGVHGVWLFTAFNEWFLYTTESVPVFNLTMCCGGPWSLVVMMFAAVRAAFAWSSCESIKWWWVGCLVASAFGLLVNVLGFLIGMGGGG